MGRIARLRTYRRHMRPILAKDMVPMVAVATEPLRRKFFGRLKWLILGR